MTPDSESNGDAGDLDIDPRLIGFIEVVLDLEQRVKTLEGRLYATESDLRIIQKSPGARYQG